MLEEFTADSSSDNSDFSSCSLLLGSSYDNNFDIGRAQ